MGEPLKIDHVSDGKIVFADITIPSVPCQFGWNPSMCGGYVVIDDEGKQSYIDPLLYAVAYAPDPEPESLEKQLFGDQLDELLKETASEPVVLAKFKVPKLEAMPGVKAPEPVVEASGQ